MFEPQKNNLQDEFLDLKTNRESLALFQLGEVCASIGASEAFKNAGVSPGWFLAKHQEGDWGEISTHDETLNNWSVQEGFRVVSAYTLPKTGEKILIITERDRSATTILLPEEN